MTNNTGDNALDSPLVSCMIPSNSLRISMKSTKVIATGLALASVLLMGAGCASGSADTSGTGSTGSSSASNSAITITKPTAGETLKSGLVAEGTSKTPGETIYSRIVDTDGSMMNEAKTTVGTDGTFKFNGIYFLTPKGTALKLEIFEKDAAGKEINKATVPFTYSK
jgi:hypothetical protein